MPAADFSIVDEVDAAINAGSAEKRLETIKRGTDLFLLSAGTFNGEQIELFDNVLERLIRTIEIRAVADISARMALAEMSSQLASVAQAPPAVVRRLAGNDRRPAGCVYEVQRQHVLELADDRRLGDIRRA